MSHHQAGVDFPTRTVTQGTEPMAGLKCQGLTSLLSKLGAYGPESPKNRSWRAG